MRHSDRGKRVDPWNLRQGRKLLEFATQKNKPLEDWRYAEFVEAQPKIDPVWSTLPNNLIPNAAASLLTTAPQYAQFMLRLLDPKTEITGQMLIPPRRLNHVLSWGLGIGLELIHAETCFWYWGDNGTFGNFMFGNPATGIATVIFTHDFRGLLICERILREAHGHDLSAFGWL